MIQHSELGEASAVIMKYVSRALALWVIRKVSPLPVVGAIFFSYRVGQIRITDSTFYNSSSINCCNPSKIRNILFLGWWRRWQSIKGNEPADSSSLSQREITMQSSQWKRKKIMYQKKRWKENTLNWKLSLEYAYFTFYFFTINIYYASIRKRINQRFL